MRLRDYAGAFRRYWLAIILMMAVGVGMGYGWAKLQTPVYEADASGYITISDQTDESLFSPGQADSLAKSKVPTYLDMATWRSVAQHAADELGLSASPEALVQRIVVENPEGTAILKITASSESPTSARDLASAWVTALASEIDRVEGSGEPGSADMTIQLGESASLPGAPIFPDTVMAMIVGLLLGLGGGVAFALVRAIADRRLRSADDVEQRLSVPVAGTLPDVGTLSGGKRLYRLDEEVTGVKAQRADFAVRESLRMLRTNLQFMNVDHPPRTIIVTSAMPGEGKSTVAANLAGTLAANGAHVILVDGDLRRPTVADTTGVNGDIGLTDVLAGRIDITQALRRVNGIPNLLVLPAGTLPPNPSELLGSERMHSLLKDLAKHAMVIVDAPPLLAVTDGAVLTRHADGALVVVSAGRTGYDVVDKAIDVLEKIHGHVLGVVLNRVPVTGGTYGGVYAYEAAGAEADDRHERPQAEAHPRKKKTASTRGVPVTADSASTARAGSRGRRQASAPRPADSDLLDELFDDSPPDTAVVGRIPDGGK
ncbi:polysaccharide biosynthesis tyrosine autokinase [Microbacterium sp.]|uniref:polysaccharide biosynthesis tyrosine autokinase n=1 Tax=Microbacterium sp. TaxID=51671 RepID=UPI002811EF12|nr:polysaccharide biosynthesis tyrosine autokinase [Microbacterium sp.]